ncbi:bicarbonate transport system substrate-binding protein [Pseudanabaena biceps PCC 7429]|uniref:Bicarbonate transport system substrate-binding protein n=2 Tax=Pseudanabaena TaxID=1152 RepID=L8N0S8_9CYAN|nr:bicarbonate transport system substrate-binding protein [Pseudanabaena biceps PCC 7429]
MTHLRHCTNVMQSRRKLLKTAIQTLGAAAGGLFLNNCSSKPLGNEPLPNNTFAAASGIPEIPAVRLGIIPSIEIAPLLVAQKQKLFAKYGMTDVQLVPFSSWQSLGEHTATGTDLGTNDYGIDGGHFYSPLPELLNEGLINQKKTAMYVLMRLHTHGGYIVASKRLKPLGIQVKHATFSAWQDIAKLFGNPMNSAIAEIGSNYDLWLRYWLAAMDIVPLRDIDILEIPLDEIIPQIKQHRADLFCLDSWRTLKLMEGNLAEPAIATGEIWRNYPGEILAMRADWVDKYPIATQAILQATMEAQLWCDDPANARTLNTLLAIYFINDVTNNFANNRLTSSNPIKMFAQLFKNSPKPTKGMLKNSSNSLNYAIKYWSNDGISVSYPYKSHDLWFLSEYQRWGLLPPSLPTREIIDAVNREDLWRNAAKAIGVPDTNIPISTSRGIETFFDGSQFDPDRPNQYSPSKA